MSDEHYYGPPGPPTTIDEVEKNWPTLRQSILAKIDDCALSAFFEMSWSQGWSGNQAAMGIMFHRFAAECLKTMKRNDSNFIPVPEALVILEECLEQRDIPARDFIRIPLRDIPTLRWVAIKFAKDNKFTIRHLVDVEHRLKAPIEYRDDDGQIRSRDLTGQLDALIANPSRDDEVIIIDWKSGWGLPPRRHEDHEDPGVSYHGYFQQKFYAWLVFMNYPSVNSVVLREFYVRRGEARPARVERKEVPEITRALSNLAFDFDRLMASGRPKRLRFPDVAPWNPSPGKHCAFCLAPHRCPIERDVRENIAVTTPAEAGRAVAELEVIEAARKSRREAIRPYIEEHGPQAAKWSKGRRVLGLRTPKSGKGSPTLTFFTPEGSDRAPEREPELDQALEDALRRSVEDLEARGEAERETAAGDAS